jgi:hypothetical protein
MSPGSDDASEAAHSDPFYQTSQLDSYNGHDTSYEDYYRGGEESADGAYSMLYPPADVSAGEEPTRLVDEPPTEGRWLYGGPENDEMLQPDGAPPRDPQ